jgi:hypothetical protein
MVPWPIFVVAGAVIGLPIGLFGVGGSSIATPLLAVLGLPGLLAVATPLPATIPSALVAAISYSRNGETRPRAAGWTMLGATPAAIAVARTPKPWDATDSTMIWFLTTTHLH